MCIRDSLSTPLVLGTNGEKLSKQNGAAPLDLSDPLATLNAAATALGLPACTHPDPNQALPAQVDQALADWVPHWTAAWTGCWAPTAGQCSSKSRHRDREPSWAS